MISVTQAATGLAVVGAFVSGAWLGRSAVKADWDASKVQDARAAVAQMDRNAERRAAADEALAGVQSAVTAALRSKPHAPPAPIKCPSSGNVLDAVLPGIGDRLRAIDAAGGAGPSPSVAVLPGAGAGDPVR